MEELTKRGRTRIPKGTRAPTINFTMRLAPKLLDQLRQAAEQNERSISAEAEKRLAQPEVNDVARMIGLVIDAAEKREGKPWNKDEQMMLLCLSASLHTLGIVFGQSMAGTLVQSALSDAVDRMSDASAGKARDGIKPSAEEAAHATKELQPTSDGMHLADELHGDLLVEAFSDKGRPR